MRNIAAKFALIALLLAVSFSTIARDATTVLLEQLDRGGCGPSSLTSGIWTISTGPVGTHGELNWGDRLEFEVTGRPSNYDNSAQFNVWKNGIPWRSADGWSGACVRDGHHTVYVVTGTVELDGCLHELAIGRLDHNDALSGRIEVIFEHAEDRVACTDVHNRDAFRHPGHAHGDHD